VFCSDGLRFGIAVLCDEILSRNYGFDCFIYYIAPSDLVLKFDEVVHTGGVPPLKRAADICFR
jgi:hypothetical protein